MAIKREGPHGPDGGCEPSNVVVQLPGIGRPSNKPKTSATQDDSAERERCAATAVYCMERAMFHVGRKRLMLLRLAGYVAGQALGFEPLRNGGAR